MKGLKTRKTIQFPQIFSIKRIAATPVVELPANGFMIKSPSFVLAKEPTVSGLGVYRKFSSCKFSYDPNDGSGERNVSHAAGSQASAMYPPVNFPVMVMVCGMN